MKSVLFHNYGSPDQLNLEEVATPSPSDDQVLIKVRAASVNPLDWHILRADPFFLRLMGFGFLKPKRKILGADIAGTVEAVGKNVQQFEPGDEVFGDISGGGFAEYACASEKALALKPTNLTFEEAASVPVGALTALQALRDHGQVQQGTRVLIHGASGGVGTFAVQIAKYFGAEVTGVCSTRNLDMVRSIGADHVIDYTCNDFVELGELYDLILAVAGHRTIGDYRRALSPGGTLIMIGGSSSSQMISTMLFSPLISMFGNKKMGSMMAKVVQKDLVFLKELLETGKVVPVIDRQYELSEAPEAIRYLEQGHARGKVVITI